MDTIRSNKKMIIAAAGLFVLVALITAGTLYALNRRGKDRAADQAQASKEELVERAKTSAETAEKSLSQGKIDEGITKLEEAKNQYEQAGDVEEVDTIDDRLLSIDREETPSDTTADDAPQPPMGEPQPAPMPW